ncbi:unnamed protein product, partial [marine sediment metagenome]
DDYLTGDEEGGSRVEGGIRVISIIEAYCQLQA